MFRGLGLGDRCAIISPLTMNRLHRYILLEILPPLVVGSVLLGLVLMLSGRFDLIAFILSGGVSPFRAARIMACLFPGVLAMTTPIAFLLACLIAYGRLSEEHEISAMRAGGFRFWDLLLPGAVMAVAISGFLWVLNARIVPGGVRVQERVVLEIINEHTFMDFFPEGRFESRFGRNLLLRVKRVRHDEQRLQGVLVFRMDPRSNRQINAIITAPEADVQFDTETLVMRMTLRDASMHRIGAVAGNPASASYTLARFETCHLDLPIRGWVLEQLRDRGSMAMARMTDGDIRAALASAGAAPDAEGLTEPVLREFRQGLATRHALALSPLALVLVGVPVGLAMRTGRKSLAFLIALVILGGYISLFAVAVALVEGGSPPVLLQASNLLVGAGGLAACGVAARR